MRWCFVFGIGANCIVLCGCVGMNSWLASAVRVYPDDKIRWRLK